MRPQLAWLLPGLLQLVAGTATAQQGSAVQLPTYSFFSTNTTVSVPDRGSVYLGGVTRAATGRNEFGTPLLPFRNRSFGTERSVTGTWVSVYIHDFEAMDEQLLSQPTAFRSRPQPGGAPGPAPGLAADTKNVWQPRPGATQSGSGGPTAKSVAQLRAERLREQQAREQEAREWLERGRRAEASGKANVARVYYRMAARRATADLKDQIAARLESLDGSPATPHLAQRRP